LKQEGKTVFLNSHLLQEVEMVCDRVAILDKGELCSIGPPDQVAPDRIEGIELELELLGTGDVARQAVGTRHVTNWSALGEDQFRVVVRLAEQSEVDQLTDDLRRAGISVVGLSRRRISLEDAFLQIIAAAGKRE
jgi:ABC-2 type transport system ATP-binding protein